MVDMKVETTEPDPAATSTESDQTINDAGSLAQTPVLGTSSAIAEENAPDAAEETVEKSTAEGEANTAESNDVSKSDKQTPEELNALIAEEANKERASPDGVAKSADTNGKEAKPPNGATGNQRSSNKRGGHQGGRKFEDYRKNVKTDFTSQKESNDPDEIRKQVEFYFSDSNLTMDKFLLEKVGGSANNAVPISVVHSFKRMRHFQPFPAIVAALKDSTILEVVDEENVKRKVPLDESFNDKPMDEVQKVYESKAMARSVYVKGFGEETPSTQFDIEAFFTPFGPTNAIRLRRADNKCFKGSVFVEFDSEETQKAFLALDPQPKWKGKELVIKSKKQYCDEKVEDIKSGKVRRNQNWTGDKRGGDNRDWRVRRDEDRKGGFKNDRGKGGNRGSRGRGRGRGGRDGHNRDREDAKKPRDEHTVPSIATSTPQSAGEVPSAASPEATKKRDREDDVGENGQGEAKNLKIDSSGIDISRRHIEYLAPGDTLDKKRAREEDGDFSGQGPAKKVDTKDEGS